MSGKPELEQIILGCIEETRGSQKMLYKLYYSLSIAIAMRYSKNYPEAEEIVNDGFLKIFSGIKNFRPAYQNYEASFTGWIKRIIIHTAIDHYRKYNKAFAISPNDINYTDVVETSASAIDNMAFKELIELVQKLSPAYRTVFNLYILDGYKHEEIAKRLKISVGASKSNLAKARMNIQNMLKQKNLKLYEQRKAI